MKNYLIICSLFLMFSCGHSQSENKGNSNQLVGGPCQGCEAIYEYGNKVLNSIDTLPKFKELPLPIRISGTVYMPDGKT